MHWITVQATRFRQKTQNIHHQTLLKHDKPLHTFKTLKITIHFLDHPTCSTLRTCHRQRINSALRKKSFKFSINKPIWMQQRERTDLFKRRHLCWLGKVFIQRIFKPSRLCLRWRFLRTEVRVCGSFTACKKCCWKSWTVVEWAWKWLCKWLFWWLPSTNLD